MDSVSEFPLFGSDPFDITLLQNFLEEEDPLVYLSNDEVPNEQPLQQQHVSFGGRCVFLPDPVIQNQPNGKGVANCVAGSSSTMRGKEHMMQDQFLHDGNDNFINGETFGNFSQPEFENIGPLIYQHEHMMSLPHWPPSPKPFFCSCCQVLRQIIHTNGSRFDKLEIHGTIGMISHAIIRNTTPGDPSSNYQMVDFCNRNKEEIKSFLKQYCEQQNIFGYIIMDDPLSAYYDALSTGMDWAQDISDEDDDLISENDMKQDQEPEHEPENEMASNARRLQRERVAKMTLGDLSDYFHIPIKETAKLLEVSTSVVKKVCRKAELYRWPQRKLLCSGEK
ncbi:uncharacterized protein LOC109790026 isoform X2 [Cajanus cajan]|uniref:uncharacterized protein LOC109790026 isoform X2 n=1 Tax=Cajanus cajan TaxID=3821 RepID=UPI0010FB8FB0|nr:uncharacterized protein LOC109790026 isoform X2 [Cajanus cajan]